MCDWWITGLTFHTGEAGRCFGFILDLVEEARVTDLGLKTAFRKKPILSAPETEIGQANDLYM
jgi:hypothetical protein